MIPIEIEKALIDFQKTFEDYGLSHLAEIAKSRLTQQVHEHDRLLNLPLKTFYRLESATTQLAWNKQVFKNNYLTWLRKFTETLNKVDKKKYPWFSKREVLEPFLRINWDDVKVVGFLDKIEILGM